jgi:hypothetical protein
MRDFVSVSGAVALALAVLAGFPAQAGAQPAAAPIVLVPHRAVYDLTLGQSRGKQSLEAARGRILYDFSGSPCEGYTLEFRQVTELDSGEGKTAISDLRTSNWESDDGNTFRFTSTNYLNNVKTDETDGRADRADGKVHVSLTKPEKKQFDAGDVIFPSAHMRRIIAAARAGKTLLQVGVYDGSESGEKIYNTLSVLGRPIGADHAPDDAAAGKLAGVKRWPVTVSYFDRSKTEGDQTPLYALGFEAYENGISRALKLDYGNFVLDGKLTELDLKPQKPCP